MVVDYKSRKKEVLDAYQVSEELVKEVRDYAEKIKLPDPTERMENLLNDIRSKVEKVKADRFKIMIAGESKSGKSTFINAYLGVELLPMDVKQCSSAIVEIKYGQTFTVIATLADGRKKKITGDDEARDFLKKNAALDDEYRNIPVPTINSEILVKSGLRAKKKDKKISISVTEVEAMLNSPEVQNANIYNLPDYNERIKAYINSKKDSWEDIVTKIEIMFPFEDDDLRGIEIVDSPGVCARGGVGQITDKYIENADAIIFLKPVIGQSLESTQFNQFMERTSVERNKNALFLVLTHIATKNEEDLRRLEEEAHKQFSGKLDAQNILFVDSKAELYAQKLDGKDNIEEELRRLNNEGSLDDFVTKAYAETAGLFGTGDTADFITKLHDRSRFKDIDNALELFGRKAHYILLANLLSSIIKLYDKLLSDMNTRIDFYKQKAENPAELEKKIKESKMKLAEIENKMQRGVNSVTHRFCSEDGIIRKEANNAVKDYEKNVDKIDPDSDNAFEELERVSFQKIDQFKELTKSLQEQVVKEFDKELIELSDKSAISYTSLKPDFTDETFQNIKESTESKAYETHEYETGVTFKKTHSYSQYIQNKHFNAVKKDILNRLDVLKNDLVLNLSSFIEKIRSKYITELSCNATAKKKELDAIQEAKNTAEQTLEIIRELSDKAQKIGKVQADADKIRGGISKYVQ